MISGQKQDVAENSLAIQAGGSVTINKGLTTSDVVQILIEFQEKFSSQIAEAKIAYDERFSTFKREIIDKFGDDGRGNRDAFCDPDFQFVAHQASVSHARIGTQDSAAMLASLLVDRSLVSPGSRLALILNQAIEVAGKLTPVEIAQLQIMFVMKRVKRQGAENLVDIGAFLNDILSKSLPHATSDRFPFDYMAALGCGTVVDLVRQPLLSVIQRQYSIECSRPMSRQIIVNNLKLDNERFEKLKNLWLPAVPFFFGFFREEPSGSDCWRVCSAPPLAWSLAPAQVHIPADFQAEVERFCASHPRNEAELRRDLVASFPGFPELEAAWDNGPLQNFASSAVGNAIGYIQSKNNHSSFSAPIEMWLK